MPTVAALILEWQQEQSLLRKLEIIFTLYDFIRQSIINARRAQLAQKRSWPRDRNLAVDAGVLIWRHEQKNASAGRMLLGIVYGLVSVQGTTSSARAS